MYIRKVFIALVCLLGLSTGIGAQGVAKVSPDQQVFNFGTIAEEDGLASHVFVITNTGNTPLVINRVTASCGCTRPEWEKEPIAPGKSGKLKVTYNPKGRPGPFYKTITIFSNGEMRRFNLAIKGNVKPQPKEPVYNYLYAIGDLKLHTLDVLYSQIRPNETLGRKISIKNTGKTSAIVSLGKLPHYMTADIRPDTLLPGKTGEITFLMDGSLLKQRGRKSKFIPVTVKYPGQGTAKGAIHLAANAVDDFSRLTTEEQKNAPAAQLSGSLLDFGTVKKGKKQVKGTVELTNTGKTPLHVYSASSDDPAIRISGGKKTIAPGETVTYKISVKLKHLSGDKLEALVNWICNDPKAPVQMMKVKVSR